MTLAQDVPIELAITIAARPETVFRYFTDSARFAQWMQPGATIEGRVGGRFCVAYPNGDRAVGEIIEMEPDRRIVFTWGYENEANEIPPESTRVTITLTETSEGTLVKLVHAGLKTDEQRTGHAFGWGHYTAMLAGAASREQFASAEQVVDAYITVWNEVDPASRAARLDVCWATDGRFMDAFACLAGRDRLNSHITNALRHLPPITLRRTSVVRQVHGWLHFRWEAVTADGRTFASGDDVGRLGFDGKLTQIVGFWDIVPGA